MAWKKKPVRKQENNNQQLTEASTKIMMEQKTLNKQEKGTKIIKQTDNGCLFFGKLFPKLFPVRASNNSSGYRRARE